MDTLIKPGRFIFAIGIIGLGILCFISKDFIAGRPPVSSFGATIPGKLVWAYVSGSLLILAAMAVIFNIQARIASLMIGVMILLCSFLLRHLYEMVDWGNAFKALALSGGAFIVAASFPGKKGYTTNNFLTNYTLMYTGCLFFSLFFIICGFLHFKFPDFIRNDFIPRYISFRNFWTYFCAICLLAGGVGLIIPKTRRWAALLSGMMILGWFLLLHIPRFIADRSNVSDRLGLCESFTFVGMLFVLAGIASKKEQY